MRDSRTKDRIIRALINQECGRQDFEIANHLRITIHRAYTLLKQMESAGHIETVETSTVHSPKSCMVRIVLPEGRHFHDRTSYWWQSVKKWWVEAPKNYWVIGTVIGLISANAALIAKLFSKDRPETIRIELIKSNEVTRDTAYRVNQTNVDIDTSKTAK